MKNVELIIPKFEDLWYREKLMSDPNTMDYNAGYDLSFDGYHYDTGCIDFPKYKWEAWYEKFINSNDRFYAYILDKDTNEYVGYLNYHLTDEKSYMMGIVIEGSKRGNGYMEPALLKLIQHAKASGIDALCDTVPLSREKALKKFYQFGFEVVRHFTTKKFGKDDECVEIRKVID